MNAISREWLNAYERGLGEQYSLHASDPHMGWDDIRREYDADGERFHSETLQSVLRSERYLYLMPYLGRARRRTGAVRAEVSSQRGRRVSAGALRVKARHSALPVSV